MNWESPTTDYIQQYLTGKLSREEQEAFETAITLNPSLNEEVRMQGIAYYTTLSTAKEEWKQELGKRFDQQPPSDSSTQNLRPLMYLAWAACLILLLGVIWWSVPPAVPPTHEALYAMYYELPEAPASPASNAGLFLAHRAFNLQDWGTAQQYYEQLLTSSPPEELSEVWLFLGLTYLELGQVDQAVEQFRFLRGELPYFRGGVQQTAPAETHEGDWYLALTYLRQHNTQAAQELVSAIISKNPNHSYRKAAAGLTRKLEKMNP